jgi:tetratricopeptide (TPR) repeat protein
MNRKIRFSIAFLFVCSIILLPAFRSPVSLAQENTAAAQSALREGKALLRQGKSNEAIGKLDSALRAFAASKSNRGQAAAHDALGELYERGGQYDIARTHYTQAHEAFTRAAAIAKSSEAATEAIGFEDASGNAYNANLMLAKIGNMYAQTGKLSEARAAFERMNAVKPEEIKPEQTVQRAKEQQQKAKRGKGLFGRVASAASSAANAVRNDPLSSADSARGAARSTASDIKATASPVTSTIKLYRELIVYATHEIGLGRVAYFNDNMEQAKTHFENALSAAGGSALNIVGRLGQSSRFRTAARTALGDIAYRQNRFDDAAKIYREAAAGAQADKRLELMWSAQRGLGRSLRAQAATESNASQAAKLRTEALTSYRASLTTIERLRAGSLQADEARIVFLATTSDVFSEAAALLGEMALLESSQKGGAAKASMRLEGQAREYAAEGLRIVEQGRARSLLDLLTEGGAELTAGVPAELVTARRANLERQQELAAEATGIALESSTQTPRAPAEIEAELANLETEYVKLENAIRTASPRYAALTAPQPLALDRIQQEVLDAETALIEYSLGEDKSYLWAVTSDSIAVFALPSRSIIEAQVVELRNTIVPESLRREITQLTAKQNVANTAARSAVEPAGFAQGERDALQNDSRTGGFPCRQTPLARRRRRRAQLHSVCGARHEQQSGNAKRLLAASLPYQDERSNRRAIGVGRKPCQS